MNETDYLIDGTEPDFLPSRKPRISDTPVYLAGDGLEVSHSSGTVMYSLDAEVSRAVSQINQAADEASASEAEQINFGFKVTVDVESRNVNIASGLLHDINYSTATGYLHREHVVQDSVISNAEFPCIVYGLVRLEDITDSDFGVFSGPLEVAGEERTVIFETGTEFKRITANAVPPPTTREATIFFAADSLPALSTEFFQFRVADIASDGSVSNQYAIGSVTVPQRFGPKIIDFVVL